MNDAQQALATGASLDSFFFELFAATCLAFPVFYLVKSKVGRENVLLLLGAYAVYVISPAAFLFWAAYWLIIWALQHALSRVKDERQSLYLLWFSIVIALMPMVQWKLYEDSFSHYLGTALNLVLDGISPTFRALETPGAILVPIGLSIATFRAVDFLICIYTEVQQKQTARQLLYFGFFPPVQAVGPIIQRSEVELPDTPTTQWSENLFAGTMRIAIGLLKIFLIALPLGKSGDVVINFESYSRLEVIAHTYIYSWFFYLNFSGFSDLAIGSARLFGLRIRENFSYPFFQRNLQQFWAHWHMSLTSWAQRNVFTPAGGMRRNRQYLATFLTMMVIALWHNLTLAMVVYGLLHAAVLIALRAWQMRANNPPAAGPIRITLATALTYTFVVFTLPMLLSDALNLPGYYRFVLVGH